MNFCKLSYQPSTVLIISVHIDPEGKKEGLVSKIPDHKEPIYTEMLVKVMEIQQHNMFQERDLMKFFRLNFQ